MAPGADLPPLEGETTRRDVPRSDQATAAHTVEPSQFTHESKLPPVRLEDAKPRLAKGATVVALAGLGSVIALATALAFSPSPPPQKAADNQTEQGSVAHGVQLPDVIQDQPTAPPPDAGPGPPPGAEP